MSVSQSVTICVNLETDKIVYKHSNPGVVYNLAYAELGNSVAYDIFTICEDDAGTLVSYTVVRLKSIYEALTSREWSNGGRNALIQVICDLCNITSDISSCVDPTILDPIIHNAALGKHPALDWSKKVARYAKERNAILSSEEPIATSQVVDYGSTGNQIMRTAQGILDQAERPHTKELITAIRGIASKQLVNKGIDPTTVSINLGIWQKNLKR